jgi:hypothetical protein
LSLALRKEHRPRVFEKRLLRRIFGPKRNGITEGCRKLHNEEVLNLYSLPNIVRVLKSRSMRWARHVARMVMNLGFHKGGEFFKELSVKFTSQGLCSME